MSKLLAIAMLFVSFNVSALPLPKAYPNALSIQQLPLTFTTDYDFEGIVALSNCSGSLIRFENSKDSDQGMILSNGHCLDGGFPRPGEFVTNQRSSRTFNLM